MSEDEKMLKCLLAIDMPPFLTAFVPFPFIYGEINVFIITFWHELFSY